MTEEEQKKPVCITHYETHVNITLPNGSWVSFEYDTGDIMGWDSRLEKNFSSLMSTEEAE